METRILRPSKVKWFCVSLIGVAFTVGGVFLIANGRGAMAWFVTLFFGAVAAVGLYILVSSNTYLKLTEDGFEQCMMGRSFKVAWSDIVDFGLVTIWGNTFVTFTQTSQADSQMGNFSQRLIGATGQLSDNFGMKPQKLMALMESYWRVSNKDQ